MTPTEIREVMKRAWEANSDILDLIYTTHAAASPLGGKAARKLAKRASKSASMVSHTLKGLPGSGYEAQRSDGELHVKAR